MYLIGQCLFEMEDVRAALDQFRRTHETYQDTEEGIAAGMEQAELSRRLGIDSGLLEVYLAVIKAAGPGAAYINPLLPYEKLRTRVLDAFQNFLKQETLKPRPHSPVRCTRYSLRKTQLRSPRKCMETGRKSLEVAGGQDNGRSDDATSARCSYTIPFGRRALRKAGGAAIRVDLSHRRPVEQRRKLSEGSRPCTSDRAVQEYLRYELRRRRPRALLDSGRCTACRGSATPSPFDIAGMHRHLSPRSSQLSRPPGRGASANRARQLATGQKAVVVEPGRHRANARQRRMARLAVYLWSLAAR